MAGAIAIATASQGGRVLWAVPSYKNGRPLMRFAENAVADLKKAGIVKVNKADRTITFANGGQLSILSMDNEDSVRGDNFDLAILDEAAMMSPTAWTDAIAPTLADKNGDAIFLSTPKGRNWFFEEWEKGNADGDYQKSWQAPTADNPNPNIKRAAQLAKLRMPQNTYEQEWLAQFLLDSGGVFRGVSKCALDYNIPCKPEYGAVYVMGVDWAQDTDFTVISCVKVCDDGTLLLVDWERFNEINWTLQRIRIKGMYTRWNCIAAIAEKNAMGGPNIEELEKEGLNIIAWTASNKSKKEVIENLALYIETGKIIYPNEPILIKELQGYSMTKLPSGMIRYSAPAKQHDDTVISLALAAMGAKDALASVAYSIPNVLN